MNIKSLSLLDPKLWPKLQIWPLTLKNDLDLMMLPLKMCSLVIVTCTPNIKCLSLLDQMLWPMWSIYLTFDLEGWPLPLLWQSTPQNVRLHKIHIHNKYKVYIYWIQSYGTNSKVDLWPCRMTLTLWWYHSKHAALWDTPVHQTSNVYLHWIKSYGQNSIFDLWPWRMTLTLWCYHSKCAASW